MAELPSMVATGNDQAAFQRAVDRRLPAGQFGSAQGVLSFQG